MNKQSRLRGALNSQGEIDRKKLNTMCIFFYIIQPIITIIGIVLAFTLKDTWYWIPLAVLLVCGAGFGINIGDTVDSFVKPRYPQCYDSKGRVSTGKLKRLAKEAGDDITLSLKRRQSSVYVVTVVCIIVLCFTAILVI